MCSDCLVTEAIKEKIAAHGAAFRKATQSPFGSEDEIDHGAVARFCRLFA